MSKSKTPKTLPGSTPGKKNFAPTQRRPGRPLQGRTRGVDADGNLYRIQPPKTVVQLGSTVEEHKERLAELEARCLRHGFTWRGGGSLSRFLQRLADCPPSLERQVDLLFELLAIED
jgi:hypothetical protein